MPVSERATDRLERSSLFVPATQWRMIEKAAASSADSVCIDLEDAVAPTDKIGSRGLVIRAFRELDFGPRERIFRINATDTSYCYRDLVEVVETAGDRIDAVMVPKVNRAGDVAFVAQLLDQIEAHRGWKRPLRLQAQIETAGGYLRVAEIAAGSDRLETLILGAGDFSASMQMPSSGIGEMDAWDESYPGHRWHAVMHAVVAAARAHGLRCLDGPYAAYRDETGFARSCRIARAMGFDGKQCIHPSQLETVNTMFTPGTEEAARAEQLIAVYERAQAEGRGAITLDGRMVDAASVRMAEVVLHKHRLGRARQRMSAMKP